MVHELRIQLLASSWYDGESHVQAVSSAAHVEFFVACIRHVC